MKKINNVLFCEQIVKCHMYKYANIKSHIYFKEFKKLL